MERISAYRNLGPIPQPMSDLLETVGRCTCELDEDRTLEGQELREVMARVAKGLVDEVCPELGDWRPPRTAGSVKA